MNQNGFEIHNLINNTIKNLTNRKPSYIISLDIGYFKKVSLNEYLIKGIFILKENIWQTMMKVALSL